MSNTFSFVPISVLVLILYFGDMSVQLSPFRQFRAKVGLQVKRWRDRLPSTTTRSKRFIEPSGCACNGLKCECCSRINLNSSHTVCIIITLVPNELTLRTGLVIDNNAIYEGTIDPSSAPICVPNLPGVCLVVNHVNIEQLQVCTKLNYFLLTFVKFPCTSIQDGKISLQPNVY